MDPKSKAEAIEQIVNMDNLSRNIILLLDNWDVYG